MSGGSAVTVDRSSGDVIGDHRQVVVVPPPRVSLWGPLHTAHGEVAVQALGNRMAIAIDRGRRPKALRSRHPNEDMAAAAFIGDLPMIVVADGHFGCEAAMLAVAGVLDWATADPPPYTGLESMADLVVELEGSVAAELALPTCGNADSATTLLMAVIDETELRWVSVGDSALFLVTQGKASQLNAVTNSYLPGETSGKGVRAHLQAGRIPLRGDEVVVAVTDGVTDFLAHPGDAIGAAVTTAGSPDAAARLICDLAGDGGAGDNVAVSLAMPQRPAPPLPWYVTEAARRMS